MNLRFFHIYKSSPYSWGECEKYELITIKLIMAVWETYLKLQINYIILPQYCTEKKFSTCKFTAFFIHFHGQTAPKLPKSLSPSPWQPDIDTKILTLVFEFLHQRAYLVPISAKSKTCRFPAPIVNTLVLRENWY